MPTLQSVPDRSLQCMEIVGGNAHTRGMVESPGFDIWVDSRPHQADSGGDVHYFSMCGSGRVTRLALADVAGHGAAVDQVAGRLRHLMRKHINHLDQSRLAVALNREFPEIATENQFATALLMTYFAPTDHLIVCNAGHPRPIWYSRRQDRWQLLDENTPDRGRSIREETVRYALARVSNLPLGVIEPTDYRQFTVRLDPGDVVMVYTDGLSDARDGNGDTLDEEGLLKVARQIAIGEPAAMGEAVLDRVAAWRGGAAPEDDMTLVVMRHNGSSPPKLTLTGVMKSVAKMVWPAFGGAGSLSR